MPKPRASLKNQRNKAYESQNGLCYYCSQSMWREKPSDFASKFHISIRSTNKFQCTGEHLIPHCEGGSPKQRNIVAACKFCNQQRHRRTKVLSPEEYKKFVQNRFCKGRWNAGILN